MNLFTDDWQIVALIAGNLMASGHYTSVQYAVKTATEIINETKAQQEADISHAPDAAERDFRP
jgi:ADP-ribosylglycohydrolase